MKQETRNKIEKHIGRTEKERDKFVKGAKIGVLAFMVLDMSLGFVNDAFSETEAPDKPAASVERLVDVDAAAFDELNIEKGSIVYNDTEDTYMVYVDDTEAHPAQEPGWYEVDMNNPVIVDQQAQGE